MISLKIRHFCNIKNKIKGSESKHGYRKELNIVYVYYKDPCMITRLKQNWKFYGRHLDFMKRYDVFVSTITNLSTVLPFHLCQVLTFTSNSEGEKQMQLTFPVHLVRASSF